MTENFQFIEVNKFLSQNRVIQRNYYAHVDEATDEDLSELEKQIKQQNIEYYELYDNIAKNLTKKDQIEILKANTQLIPGSKYEVCIFYIFRSNAIIVEFLFRLSID